jgi:hypothetical protein
MSSRCWLCHLAKLTAISQPDRDQLVRMLWRPISLTAALAADNIDVARGGLLPVLATKKLRTFALDIREELRKLLLGFLRRMRPRSVGANGSVDKLHLSISILGSNSIGFCRGVVRRDRAEDLRFVPLSVGACA